MAVVASTPITTAVSLVASAPVGLGVSGTGEVVVQIDFAWGSGGTSGTVWLQTSLDGTTWIDIASMSFLAVSKSRVLSLSARTVITAAITPTDGTLAADTAISGVLGQLYRTKLTTVGTYAGGTAITVQVFPET